MRLLSFAYFWVFHFGCCFCRFLVEQLLYNSSLFQVYLWPLLDMLHGEIVSIVTFFSLIQCPFISHLLVFVSLSQMQWDDNLSLFFLKRFFFLCLLLPPSYLWCLSKLFQGKEGFSEPPLCLSTSLSLSQPASSISTILHEWQRIQWKHFYNLSKEVDSFQHSLWPNCCFSFNGVYFIVFLLIIIS